MQRYCHLAQRIFLWSQVANKKNLLCAGQANSELNAKVDDNEIGTTKFCFVSC